MIYDRTAARKHLGAQASLPAIQDAFSSSCVSFDCEGGQCRIFEVTPDKEIVLEFRSPFKKKGSLSTYRARRYSPEFVKPLLER